jgi:hypothetical protein
MRRFALSFSFCLPLLLTALLIPACSLVVDFPPPRGEDPDEQPELDAGRQDAGRDSSVRDASRDTGPSATNCNLETHAGCDKDELCCKTSDSADPSCIAVSSGACATCRGACTSDAAPYCTSREGGCECVAGSGQPCAAGESCTMKDGVARCVECSVDTDCDDPALPVCVNNRCRQCDRGAKADDAIDDRGCSAKTPICNQQNRCEACTAAPADNCPEDQQCTPSSGCFGCRATADVTNNGCSAATPICKAVSTDTGMQMQCVGCKANEDCKPLLYCDQRSGTCNNVCDPDGGIENDGCEGATPVCKATESGSFACRACAPSDCTNGRFCAQGAHPKSGSCVACRNDGDCPGTAPICDTTTYACRARVGNDCRAGQQLLNGECVECVTNAHCAGNPKGAFCAGNVCGQCATSANCPPDKPVCDTSAMPFSCGCSANADCTTAALPFCDVQQRTCKGCATDSQCRTKFPNTNCNTASGMCVGCTEADDCPAETPLCSAQSTCVACDVLAAAADAQCAMRMAGRVCSTAGGNRGECTVCDPSDNGGCTAAAPICNDQGSACVACDPATEMGCTAPNGECFVRPGSAAPSCNACEPNATNAGCPAGATCRLVSGSYVCQQPVVDAGVPEGGV